MPTRRFYRFGSFRLDPDARVLLRDADMVSLPPKAVETLLVLVRSAGQPVDKEALIHDIWPDTFVEENNLAHHISVLRKALSHGEGSTHYIETIPKRGYRFIGDVREEVARTHEEIEPVPPPSAERKVEPSPTPPRAYRGKLAIALAVTAIAGVVIWWTVIGGASPTFQSLAVLPFRNLSGDSRQDYVAEGLTDALIGEVSRIGALRVISRTSVMRYKDNRKALPRISRELDAGAVIEGSVARFGDQIRVSVHLFDARNDRRLWGETYERPFGEMPRLWREVAASIAREIRLRIERDPRGRERAVPREAFEAYLRGRYYWNKRTPENIQKAIDFFRKAIDEDPAYAQAYAGLADCYNQLGTVLIGGMTPMESRPMAIASAKRALEIDPELPEAHAALAYARLYDWEWSAAEEGFQRAIRLNPSYASAHLWYAHYLSMRLRPDEALREVRLARQLDPLSPIIRTQVGWILQHAGRYDEAIEELQAVLAADPQYLWALWRIGSSYASKSMYPQGIDALEKAAALSHRSPSILGTLAETYGLAGRKEDARKLLRELEEQSRRHYVPGIAFAHAYMGVGDSERVLDSLEKAYQRREQGIAWLATWQDYGGYRSNPRFRELLRRVGLPEH